MLYTRDSRQSHRFNDNLYVKQMFDYHSMIEHKDVHVTGWGIGH